MKNGVPVKHDLSDGEVYLDYDIIFLKYPEELLYKANNYPYVFAEAIRRDARDIIYEYILKTWGDNSININAGFLFQARDHSIKNKLQTFIKIYAGHVNNDIYGRMEQSILNLIANELYNTSEAGILSASLHALTDEVNVRVEDLEYIHLTGICRNYKPSMSLLKFIENKRLVNRISRLNILLNEIGIFRRFRI